MTVEQRAPDSVEKSATVAAPPARLRGAAGCMMHPPRGTAHRGRTLREAVTVQSCQMHDDAHAPLRSERVQSQPYVAMAIS
eukprot:CAMPEP_0181206152 /NCGR_PEP_ID=MMETSP1096-20121128/20878_1 /TAXON_ID=156174 ORGANISM="Chrysochromulina ericina, Strain CCMP281" /NCGR_SAMPLE_ID=MMETSP1096 /ASSEMBLY_ACC=CAM_ASM_000453 /LENGTH=80 /DNA_ID=CAMNT_0023297023 /DNA_START=484 /DNA_END=726 /DNA_ORIENTATION=+